MSLLDWASYALSRAAPQEDIGVSTLYFGKLLGAILESVHIGDSDCVLGSSGYFSPLGGLKIMVGDYDISKPLNLESTIKGLKGID
jgi:hypothetical protein